ncbi:MAG: BON domain-containing protein [Pirellulaceae bacterium]
MNQSLKCRACWLVLMAMGMFSLSFGAVPAAAQKEPLKDSDITLAVETELIYAEAVPAHKIDVSTENGIVTLAGSVDSYYAKLEAENVARSVKGVLAVINNIVVQPVERTDAEIREDVVAALLADPVTETFEIDVSVDEGIVTLTGEVDSYTEKRVAEEVAERVRGVVDVENALNYDVVSGRTDADIQADVSYRLKSTASIDATLVTVNVDDGNVTLEGSVGSAAEKSEAETEAWLVPGVTSITNNLEVKWWLDGGRDAWGDGWTDADMQEAIENALVANPRLTSFDIVVAVENGVATLSGTVENLEAKRAAEEEAQDTLGVWRVKNYIRVRPSDARTDAAIANDVRDALRRDPYVDRYDIGVNVYNGKVFLTGEVDSWYMKDLAEENAAGVRGVTDIRNNLDVDYEATAKTDREIKEDIESQLFWSPFVDSDDVTVKVRSGVATLMGTVEDWDEMQAAKENARDGGATSVINKLDVEHGYGAD